MASDRDSNRAWTRDEALAYAYRRGDALRRRRSAVVVATSVAVVALAAGALAAVAAERADQPVVSTNQVTTTTDAARTTSTTASTTTSTTLPPGPAGLDGDTPIDFGGIGPIRAGMTLREAEQAAGVPLVVTDFEGFGGYCYSAYPQGMEDDVHIMVVSPNDQPVSDPKAGVVGRVSGWDTMASPAISDRGIGPGSTVEQVRAAYEGLPIDESPHEYVDGSYLDVHPPQGDTLLRFETDRGTVTAIHAGLPDAARAVEGCA